MLDRWFLGNNTYDALFVEQLPPATVRSSGVRCS